MDTTREDYSPDGTAWEYFPHDHACSRATLGAVHRNDLGASEVATASGSRVSSGFSFSTSSQYLVDPVNGSVRSSDN
jgi:hypothetical protein